MTSLRTRRAHLLSAPASLYQGSSALPVLVLAEGDLLMRCHTVMFCHPDMCVVWDVAAALLLNAGQCNLSCVHKRAASLFLWFILTDFRDRRHHNN